MLTHGVGAFNEKAFLRYQNAPENVVRGGLAKKEGGLHRAQKPVRLLMTLTELTTLEGQIVLDPFCGSGSTLVAAKILMRRYIGYDNDPACVETARERLAPDMFERLAQ